MPFRSQLLSILLCYTGKGREVELVRYKHRQLKESSPFWSSSIPVTKPEASGDNGMWGLFSSF
jgi:hypothetical protein